MTQPIDPNFGRPSKPTKYDQRVARGLAWLKVIGPTFSLDPTRIPAHGGLDCRSEDNDPLSWAYFGYLVSYRTKFQQICDRLTREMFGNSEKKLEKFLVSHGFDLPDVSWFREYILRQDGMDDWSKLTAAWRRVLLADRAKEPAK